MVGYFHLRNGIRLSSFSALGACRAVRILLRIQPRSGCYLCQLTFLYIHTFHPRYIHFQPRFSFHFLPVYSSRLSTTPHSSPYHTQPPSLCFVSSFRFLYAVHQHRPLHIMPVRKTTPDKTHYFQWPMFQIHVAPQPLGTVHYLPLLVVTSRPFRATIMESGAAARSLYPIIKHHNVEA